MNRPARRSSLRLASRVALSALFGAAATVLVAWGLYQRVGWNLLPQNGPSPADGWPEWLPNDLTKPDTFSWGAVAGKRSRAGFVGQPGESAFIRDSSAGWPLKALTGGSVLTTGPERRFFVWTLSRSSDGSDRGSLPLWPEWPGFAVDTVFYGGLAFIVWDAPGFVRRRVRRRLGRCVGCGYDLSGAAGVCPECGGGGGGA